MANITTRSVANGSETDPGSVSAKGSALSHTELDSNFLLLNNKKLENTTDDFTGTLSVKGSGSSAVGEVRFHDNDDSHHVNVKSPATISTSYTLTLPAADGSTGQFLKTDGSGNLSFATVTSGSGDITSVVAGAGLTDGATTGDATLNVGAGTGIAVNANDVAIDYTAVTELTSGLASTDELVLNDAGVLKRMDISVLSAYTASLSETLTNKTLTTPVIASISNTGTLTLPTSTDTLVGRATTDTLTNKTFDAEGTGNSLSNVDVANLKSGVLDTDISAVSSSDDTLASAKAIKTYVDAQVPDDTDGLSEGSSNLYFTNARAQAVSINNLSEDTSPQLGGALDVNGNKIVSTSGADIDIEPNGTGDVLLGNFKFDADQTVGASQDNFVLTYDNSSGKISLEAASGGGGGITASSTDTLTNKSLTAPILTGSSSSAGSILFKEDTDNGTNAVTLIGPAATDDVTVTLPAAATTLVGTDTTDTLTNKTLTTPVIASISNTGTLTLPTSTDTLVGRATTDTLTNKTLTSPSIAGGTITSQIDVNDDTKIRFGNDADAFVRWRNSSSRLEANINGNLMINVSDSGASGKGNCRIRTDNKLELEAGKDRDNTGDLLLTSFDDFQFRKNGFASTDTDLSPTTDGSTSVVLGRALTTGETNAFGDFALFFFDGDPTNSSQLREMSRYLEVDAETAVTGSGATTTITLFDAPTNLSNATHSAGKYLQFGAKSPAVVVDGTRGRLEDKEVKIQNRLGFEQPNGMSLIFEAIEFHDGEEYLGTGTGAGSSNPGEERPVKFNLFTEANKNNLTLEHTTTTTGSDTTKDIFEVRGRSSTASTVASKTAPDMIRYNVDIDAEKTVVLHNQSGDPSGVSNASHIYAKDESSSSEVFVRDEAGNVTKISPHNEQGEWEYYSRNIKTGKTVRVNMERMIGDLEKLTGNKYIENE